MYTGLHSPSRILILGVIITIFTLSFLINQGSTMTDENLGYPVITMDYKIFVEAGKECCVFQRTKPGAVFHVEFYVIRGGDGNALFAIRDPQGVIIMPYQINNSTSYETQSAVSGYYAICVDNYSRYSAQLISVYMVTYQADAWERFYDDMRVIDETVQNATNTFKVVAEGVKHMKRYLHESRSLESQRNYAVLIDIRFNIGFWSMVQFIIILGSGINQVYKIRQFFKEIPAHGKYKVRL